MFFMKSFCRVILVIIMMSLSVCLFGQEEFNHPYDRLIEWYKIKEINDVNSTSKYSVQEYADIKQDIIDYLLFDVTDDMDNDLKTEYSGIISNEIWENSNFYGYTEEQNYYFNDNTTDEYDDFIDIENSIEEFICYKMIELSGDYPFKFKYCGGGSWVGNEWYAAYEINTKIDILFNNNTNANLTKTFSKEKEKVFSGKWLPTGSLLGLGIIVPIGIIKEGKINLSSTYTFDSENPIINQNFFNKFKNYYGEKYIDSTSSQAGNWYEYDESDGWFLWENKQQIIQCFYARSPRPFVMGEKIFTKHFGPDEEMIASSNKIYDTEIKTDFNVKLLYARFYKYNKSTNEWEYDKANNPDCINYISIYEDGIDRIKISEENGKRFQNEGKYMMILSCVDKFNKIYIFEPEFFIIDKNAPEYDPDTITANTDVFYNSPAGFPVIADFTDAVITDEIIDFEQVIQNNQLDKYIYIKEKYVTDPIRLADSENFTFEDNKIKLTAENKYVYVDKIYIQDLAGNESEPIVTDQKYAWDRTAPVLNNNTLNAEYLTSKQNLYLNIEEAFGVTINSVLVKLEEFPDITSSKYFHYESRNDDLLIIDLLEFKEMEGVLNVIVNLTDLAGNQKLYINNDLSFKFDDKAPTVTATLNDDALYNYYNKAINTEGRINVITSENNFDRVVIDFHSNVFREDDIILYSKDAESILSKIDGVDEEIFSIKVYDKADNVTEIENIRLIFSNDTDPPFFVNASRDIQNKWRYDLEAKDTGSYIKSVYFKEIDAGSDDVSITDFEPLPPDSWDIIAENIKLYKNEIDILPGKAVCLILEDGWGNKSEGLILSNKQAGYYEVYNRQDLIDTNWDLSGDVIIYDDLDIYPGEILEINSVTGQVPATIRFNSGTNKIKITNNGIIKINSEADDVVFTCLNDSNNDYTWLGIINESGILDITGSNRVIFKNAVSPIVYENPGDNVFLNMIDFYNCKMGVHFIDDPVSYSYLTISNMKFRDMIYGIKFDLSTMNNKNLYMGSDEYLTADTAITKDNIIRADVYCPLNGIEDFTNVNNAPEVLNVVIPPASTIYKVGDTLTVVYEYYDINEDDENLSAVKYQWYVSNNMQGPYSPIEGTESDSWTVPSGYGGKWIKARVITEDIEGGISSPGYSFAVPLDNTAPTAENPIIEYKPVRDPKKINIGDMLTATFTYEDEVENDPEGKHIYKWYVSDTNGYNGTLIENIIEKSWIPGELDYADKYIYFTVNPVDDGGAVGEMKYSNIEYIENLMIPEIKDGVYITKETINDTIVLVGNYETDPLNSDNEYFVYEWYKIDKDNNEYKLEGFNKNILNFVSEFEGYNIIFRITPANEAGEHGLTTSSDPFNVPYTPPRVINVEIECYNKNNDTTVDCILDDGTKDYSIPRLYNYLKAVPDLTSDNSDLLVTVKSYQWYEKIENYYYEIPGETDETIDITEELLGKKLSVEVIAINNVGIESNPVKSDEYKTCKEVELNINIEKIINNQTIKFENSIGNFYFDTTADVTQQSYIFSLNDLLDLTKEEYKDVSATLKIQGAGGGGGGGCDSEIVTYTLYYMSNATFSEPIAGTGGGGGGTGAYEVYENVELYPDEINTVLIGKGGEYGQRGDKDSAKMGGNGFESVISFKKDGENIYYLANGGIGGEAGSFSYDWVPMQVSVYTGYGPGNIQRHHGTGGTGGALINQSGISYDGENGYETDANVDTDGGHGGNGASINGIIALGGECYYSDSNYHYGLPGQDVNLDAINSGNGGGGGAGGGHHNEEHNGANGGNGGHGYVIIELSGVMYTTDWE